MFIIEVVYKADLAEIDAHRAAQRHVLEQVLTGFNLLIATRSRSQSRAPGRARRAAAVRVQVASSNLDSFHLAAT
jgi:hypothetical protein